MMKPSILYVIDDASRDGGAHIATRKLIFVLRSMGCRVDLFCENSPTTSQVANMGGPNVYMSPIRYHSFKWLLCGLWRRIIGSLVYPNLFLDPLWTTRRLMKKYDVVCVMSEGSIFRNLVASLPNKVRKVQLIHTNYRLWCKNEKSSRLIAYKDRSIYPRMDAIGVVGRIGADEFKAEFQDCKDNVLPFYNMLDGVAHKYSREKSPTIRLVTIARVEDA